MSSPAEHLERLAKKHLPIHVDNSFKCVSCNEVKHLMLGLPLKFGFLEDHVVIPFKQLNKPKCEDPSFATRRCCLSCYENFIGVLNHVHEEYMIKTLFELTAAVAEKKEDDIRRN